MDLCACEIEEREHGVGVGANSTLLSDTLQSKGLSESVAVRAKVWFRKKTIDCVNSTLLSIHYSQ
jgi:hypothetical protein